MNNQSLSEDQTKRIEATLKRIREGLAHGKPQPFNEPAHVFNPEAYDDKGT